ncbi:hypothetical protein ACET3Z_032072 [Daucus carota]
MDSLSGKLESKTEIKSDRNVFHQLFRDETHHISCLSPERVHGVELIQDEKAEISKELIEEIDEEKKSIRFKVVGGDPLKQYKAFTFVSKVDKKDDNTYIVTWTIEYEKLHEAVPPPNAMMNHCIQVTKYIENRQLQLQPHIQLVILTMTALSGKLVSTTEIKADGNVFHQLFRDETHRISSLSPERVHGVELLEGVWGTQGSVICSKYVFDGKEATCTNMYEEIDEENKMLRFKVVAGDPLKHYKAFTFISKVDKIDDNTYTVTWTIEYEKLNAAIPPPHEMMNFCVNVTKDIENRYLQLQPQC